MGNKLIGMSNKTVQSLQKAILEELQCFKEVKDSTVGLGSNPSSPKWPWINQYVFFLLSPL